MAQTLKELVQNYTKNAPASDDTLKSFLEYAYVDVVHKVIKIFPQDIGLMLTLSTTSSSNGVDVSDAIYIDTVMLGDYVCEQITFSESLRLFGLHSPTNTYPASFIKDSKLYSSPAPTSTNLLQHSYIPYQLITVGNTSITKCPEKYLNVVCKKAAIEVMQNLLANKEIDYSIEMPIPPNALELSFTSKEVPSYIPPDAFSESSLDSTLFTTKTITLPSVPALPVLSTTGVSLLSDDGEIVEIDNLPTDLDVNRELVLPTMGDIDDFEIGTVLDNIIDWDSTENPIPKEITNMPVLSDYLTLSDTLVVGDLDLSGISIPSTLVTIDSDDISFPASVPVINSSIDSFTTEFSDLSDLIDKDSVDEDIELASAHIQNINMKLQQQQQQMQAYLNDFNEQNVEFQAKLQTAIANASNSNNVKIRASANELQRYSTAVQQYQIDVNSAINKWQQKDVQEAVLTYTTNKANAIQAYQIDVNKKLSEFSTVVQGRTNEVSAQINEYRSVFERYVGEFKVNLDSKVGQYTAKATAAIQQYSNDINKDIQQFSNNVQKHLRKYELENNINLSKYTADVQKAIGSYSAEISGLINNYQALSASYIQKFSSERNVELAKFQAEVAQAIQVFQSASQSSIQSFQADVKNYELLISTDQNLNSSNIGNYQAEVASYSSQVQSAIQQANAEMQKASINYQWLANQLSILINEYNSFFYIQRDNDDNDNK